MIVHKNTQAFSLVMAMLIVLIMTMIALFILEYMIPYSRSVSWIENSSQSYYQAYSWVEKALLLGWVEAENSSSAVDNWYVVDDVGTLLPPSGQWNSEYDSDWNRIRVGEPIQLQIGEDMVGTNWSNARFYFRVPAITDVVNLQLSGTNILHWQLSSATDSWNMQTPIQANQICGSRDTVCSAIGWQWVPGINLFGVTEDLNIFYNDHCDITEECSLKITVLSDLELQTNGSVAVDTRVPYIEWRADFWSDSVPLRFSQISASGKSYGFKKDLNVSVPQQTVIEAFDFTVFQ